MTSVDLNCDMGEGCPNDAELMQYVSSVNVACGRHAGDRATMARTVELAIARNVAVGAHPSFPDRANFGRTRMTLASSEIFKLVIEQVEELRDICRTLDTDLVHVKPHGALYNQSACDLAIASAVAEAVKTIDPSLILFGLSGSLSIRAAKELGLQTRSEVFADRSYQPDGSLTPRSEPNALIYDTDLAAMQALLMVRDGAVNATNGTVVAIEADTICIHGDGANAVELAVAVREILINHDIKILALNG